MKKSLLSLSVVAMIALSGCSNKSETLGPDVYDEHGLNQEQNAKTIQILSIVPAKVRVDNTENKRLAQAAGGVVGAVGGAVLGHKMGGRHETGGAVAGGAIGGVLGAGAGSMVSDTKVIDAVTITYKDGKSLKSSTQAGRVCQYANGEALMISSYSGETRIQPNAVCAD
ncbi:MULTISPECIES: glycine zipper 2TM domain-containing protein [unclassified Campylobacter]|uniref:glycine zipper 2TM domain-containing protein n=1 Tax=unclassified Campylobacter TaxID=2593542 RepID=UPI0022E9EFE8|nr:MULTISPECIES: glycine zipper 2TM domain-containing protein [unclassified Campylobacter]MDA3054436.1 glycine zipper 2TM domain-containing protein [Campylobacter sp. VBCF_07 NA4]MDA3060778.1 glycine zipper 2TM domain-containing protein [Campylobacter sp. VBCF_02 NA5]MDA3069955.1 glycine zipper 2TM domain-containing protein [Campylobacter sp. VBCF_08 NA3]WBR54395.1 glycine zipper 2TM domain-containing protein [Campylobacter sp. VBCF_01 NA2]